MTTRVFTFYTPGVDANDYGVRRGQLDAHDAGQHGDQDRAPDGCAGCEENQLISHGAGGHQEVPGPQTCPACFEEQPAAVNCHDAGGRHSYGGGTGTWCVRCNAQRVGYRAQTGAEQRRAAARRRFNGQAG